MLDLVKLPEWYLSKYGAEKVAEVAGSKSVKFTLEMVNALLAFDPTPLHKVKPLYTNPESTPKLLILVPTTGPVDYRTMECLCAMKEPGIALKTYAFWNPYDNRNGLAAYFLASSAEWAFWSDADMCHPFGNAAAFKRLVDAQNFPDVYAGIHTINRLLYHKKSLIGVAYRGRKRGAGFQFGGSSGLEMKADLKRGPHQQIVECPWVGFGGMLMHRRVLEDIIKTQGPEIHVENQALRERLGYEHAFFLKEDRNVAGDDIGFELRAKRAGHPTFVDLSLFSSHAGNIALNFQDA